jgi:thermostable 8-oxoguanine DNA glycosylase
LEGYAYEHQGSPQAYPIIAKQTIEKVFHGRLETVNSNQPTEAWKIYNTIAESDFNRIKTNATHNPMNNYQGVLTALANENIPNIAIHVRGLIEEGKTKTAHYFIDSIRGIGTKIASFYLRDIAYLGGLNESHIQDSFYLQPFDTWLDQIFSIIMEKPNQAVLEEKQKMLVELCREAGCSPIGFNQGAWIVGSQIAGDYNTFKKIAFGEESKAILEQYIEEERTFLSEIEKIATKISADIS